MVRSASEIVADGSILPNVAGLTGCANFGITTGPIGYSVTDFGSAAVHCRGRTNTESMATTARVLKHVPVRTHLPQDTTAALCGVLQSKVSVIVREIGFKPGERESAGAIKQNLSEDARSESVRMRVGIDRGMSSRSDERVDARFRTDLLSRITLPQCDQPNDLVITRVHRLRRLPDSGRCPTMKHPAEWKPEEIQAYQDRLRKLEASSQKLRDLLQGRKLTTQQRLKIVELIKENLEELERLERINAGLIARLCGTFVASCWIM